MKLRIRGNAIRIRLTLAELARLRDAGRVEEAVEFGASTFAYALETSEAAESTRASFENDLLIVSIPRPRAEKWMDSEEVGIDALQPNGSEEGLRILIEKDFPCRHRSPEDDRDAFAPPAGAVR